MNKLEPKEVEKWFGEYQVLFTPVPVEDNSHVHRKEEFQN